MKIYVICPADHNCTKGTDLMYGNAVAIFSNTDR